MLKVNNNFSLKEYNTFNIDAVASQLVKVSSVEECKEWIYSDISKNVDILVIGEGSNLLFTRDFDGVVLQPLMNFIKVIEEDKDRVLIEVGAGCRWDDFVMYCVENSFYGVENLSLIPGSVGASPVQNIGAYGVEVKDVIEEVKGVFIDSGDEFCYKNKECGFEYRNSIFKKELRGKVVITSVVYRLSKKISFNLNYGHLRESINDYGEINIENIRSVIVSVRKSKLPDPVVTGNAGSFFKNPEIQQSQYDRLKVSFPGIPGYNIGNNLIKVPAGWLIDKAGWKGKKMGRAGVHPQQALVLINLGNATGKDILILAKAIEDDIYNKFHITLEKEVNVI